MSRYDILCGRKIEVKKINQYFYGFDFSLKGDKSVVAVCHSDDEKIVYDYIGIIDKNIQSLERLNNQYPITAGQVDIILFKDILSSVFGNISLKRISKQERELLEHKASYYIFDYNGKLPFFDRDMIDIRDAMLMAFDSAITWESERWVKFL